MEKSWENVCGILYQQQYSSNTRAGGRGMALDPEKTTRRHGYFVNSTCNIGLSHMRHGGKNIVTCDIAVST